MGGYGDPKTLTDDSMVENCLGDIRALRPTLFAAVPMVYDRIKAGILRKVGSESTVKQLLFENALKLKQKAWMHNIHPPGLDRLIILKEQLALLCRVLKSSL